MSGRLAQGWNVALALVCLAMIALIYAALAVPGIDPQAGPAAGPATNPGASGEPPPDAGAPGAPGVIGLPPLSGFREIAQRPLFSETRRPAARAAPATAQPAPALDFVLTGIVTIDGDAIAFLRLAGEPTALRATAGENIRGWRVDRILPDRIVLRHGDRIEELKVGKPAKGKD